MVRRGPGPPPQYLCDELILLAAAGRVPGLVLQPPDVPAGGRRQPVSLHEVAHDDGGRAHVAVDLAGLGQVSDARVGAHEHVDGVEAALQEALLGL